MNTRKGLTLARGTSRDERLDRGDEGGQTALQVRVLGLDGLLCPLDGLQLLVGLLGGQLLDTALQGLDLVLCALADGSLGFPV